MEEEMLSYFSVGLYNSEQQICGISLGVHSRRVNKRIQCMVYLHNGALFRYKKNTTMSFVEKWIELENRLIKRQTGRQTKASVFFHHLRTILQSYLNSRRAGREAEST